MYQKSPPADITKHWTIWNAETHGVEHGNPDTHTGIWEEPLNHVHGFFHGDAATLHVWLEPCPSFAPEVICRVGWVFAFEIIDSMVIVWGVIVREADFNTLDRFMYFAFHFQSIEMASAALSEGDHWVPFNFFSHVQYGISNFVQLVEVLFNCIKTLVFKRRDSVLHSRPTFPPTKYTSAAPSQSNSDCTSLFGTYSLSNHYRSMWWNL